MFNTIKVKRVSALFVLKFLAFPYILFLSIWLWSSSIHRNVQYKDGQQTVTSWNWLRQMSSVNKGQLNETKMVLEYSSQRRELTSANYHLRNTGHELFNEKLDTQTVYSPHEYASSTLVSGVRKAEDAVKFQSTKKAKGKSYKKVGGKLIYSWLSENTENNLHQYNILEMTSNSSSGLLQTKGNRNKFVEPHHQEKIFTSKLLIKQQSKTQLLTSDQLISDGLINVGYLKKFKTKKSSAKSKSYNRRWQKITNNSLNIVTPNKTDPKKPNEYTNFLDFISVNSRQSKRIKELKLRSFQAILTKHDIRIFQELLVKFSQIAEEWKLPYFLYSGSLLGSYRHHGMIPWDDDIDVMMNASLKNQIKQAFSNVYPQYQLYSASKFRWKFYSSLSQPIKRFPWAWPFIDISFYEENVTHIWDQDPIFSNSFCFERSTTFPVTSRPFCHSMHPAPKNFANFLAKTYNVDICQTTVYSHKTEESISYPPPVKIPCSDLIGTIPLVQRKTVDSGFNETLMVGNKIISQVFISN